MPLFVHALSFSHNAAVLAREGAKSPISEFFFLTEICDLNDMAPCYISAMTHLQNTDPTVTFLPWHISRTLILLNINNDCDPLRSDPAGCFQIFQTCRWHELYYRWCSPLEWSSCLSTWIAVLAYVQEAAKNSLVSIIFVLCFFFLFLLQSAPFFVGRYINALVIIIIWKGRQIKSIIVYTWSNVIPNIHA